MKVDCQFNTPWSAREGYFLVSSVAAFGSLTRFFTVKLLDHLNRSPYVGG